MTGTLPLCPFIRAATKEEVLFHKSIIRIFMVGQDQLETNLFQLFVHPETSEWFSKIPVIIFEVNIAAEQKETLVTIFFVSYKFHCLQLFYCPRCPITVPVSLLANHKSKWNRVSFQALSLNWHRAAFKY